MAVGLTQPSIGYLCTVQQAVSLEVFGGDIYGFGMCLTNAAGFYTLQHEWELHQSK